MTFDSTYPGTCDSWNGFERHAFQLGGVDALLVQPHKIAPSRPWIWRARFFDAWPAVDLALLARGFHLTYCDVADLYGSRPALDRWDRFYRYATKIFGLADRAVLEGFSRGGLPVYNWAAENPDKVCCIYADAPVCDIRSWPGGKGRGHGNPEDWRKCLAAYRLSEEEAATFAGNPLDHLAPIAAAGIRLIHVCGDADEGVPVAENTAELAERYRQLGGRIEVILKPGVGHHPHSLEDPTPIVDFILQAWNEKR